MMSTDLFADAFATKGIRMELFVFARFHARPGNEGALERALQRVVVPTRAEAGCLSIGLFRSTRNPRLFYIHSRWVDEAAFDLHATLPHTTEFLPRAESLIDHALDITRAELIG
jgi:quinol monooxygenase YgiN